MTIEPHTTISDATIFHADCRDVLRQLEDNSIDSIVTDPPYALVSIVKRFGKPGSAPAKSNEAYQRASAGFMGKSWDTGEVAFSEEFWTECLRVLKPGGHVVAFSGTRTYHRMAVAIEDAGFEIRDQLGWLYGSGFPKSHDVAKALDKAAGVEFKAKPASGVGFMGPDGPGGYNVTKNQLERTGESTHDAKHWQGWGTAIKPAWEPICLARKPLSEKSVAANVLKWGVGALNIDGCRVEAEKKTGWGGKAAGGNSWNDDNCGLTKDGAARPVEGRWPANIIHDGSDEVLAAFPSAPGQQRSVGPEHGSKDSRGIYGDFGPREHTVPRVDETKSAARFFYCAKASRADRDDGLDHLQKKEGGMVSNTSGQHITRREEDYKPKPRANTHPTVKPTELMRWLCRLVTPPGGTVLDPFLGSGSTGRAALMEGFKFIGCEREDEYLPIAEGRIRAALKPTVKPAASKPKADPNPDQQTLFAA